MNTERPLHDSVRAAVLDVDGVVSPLHGHTAWGDDQVAGNVFGPVHVSPTMCTRLDALAAMPGVSCWWLTSWTEQMRHAMNPFPGGHWPMITAPSRAPRAWWKWAAIQEWIDDHPEIRMLAWCDDHLVSPLRRARIRQTLAHRDVDTLLIAPQPDVGLTPAHLVRVEQHLRAP